jgi:ClpP class serine protease
LKTPKSANAATKASSEVQETPPKKSYDLNRISDLISLIRDEQDEQLIASCIAERLSQLQADAGLSEDKIVLLYDAHDSIAESHSNRIYSAISSDLKDRRLLMVLLSDGGKIEPAYLISKACKRLSSEKFIVSVPRRAKSAATLIALGANEIHMGLLSELGPIDPQINGYPALGLANALEKIAALTVKFPEASEMFAKYITANLSIRMLGYFERINESAVQYAQRLLNGKNLPDNKSAKEIADHFTNHYKDHAFVIDSDEASQLLGSSVVKELTKEYEFGNGVFEFLDLADTVFSIFKGKHMSFVGSIENGLLLKDIPAKN